MDRTTLAALPKAVLHDHLDGGLRIGTLMELAEARGYDGLPGDRQETRRLLHQGGSGSLESYLDAFRHTVAVMQTPEDLSRIAYECLEDHAADGVVYAEIRFAPILHLRSGLSREDVIEAVLDGMARARRDFGIVFGVIVDALRQLPGSDTEVRAALRFVGEGVVGFDLSGLEQGNPPDAHLAACRAAREGGLGLTIHAGEGDGAASIWRALGRCHAQRIGHGARVVDDTITEGSEIRRVGSLAGLVRDHRVPLELCPTSNLHTGLVPSPADHPIGRLHRAGFVVTVNTDNRLMSGVTMTDEMALVVDHQGFTLDDLEKVTVTALETGFGDWCERRRLIDEAVRPAYEALRVAPT